MPRDALAFFKGRGLRPSFSYLDVAAEEHALSFTVAKSAGFDILGDVRDALARHLEEGGTLQTFEKRLTPVLQEAGWWGERETVDPKTGKKTRAQLGSPRRLETVFRANMRSARAAGQWGRIQRTKRTHPFLLYQLGPSEEHRPEHAAWNGTILPADDPWWNDHFPPGGWGCKCWVRQLSAAEAKRLGGVTARPRRNEIERVNPRTGKTVRVDRGLDPSWAGNPGRDRARLLAGAADAKLAALAALLPPADREKLRQAEAELLDLLGRMDPGRPPR